MQHQPFAAPQNLVRETDALLQKALKEKGPDTKVGFPNTAYYLPTILGLLGRKVETVGDMVPVMEQVKTLHASRAAEYALDAVPWRDAR